MSAESPFEMELANLFAAYADGAPVVVDSSALAASIAHSRPRGAFGRLSFGRGWVMPALIALLLVALAVSVAVVGAWLLRSDPSPLPHTGVFIQATDMRGSRTNPTLINLADGRVLISGGPPAEVYNPATDTTQGVPGDGPTGVTNSSVLLKDGRVLLINSDGIPTSSRAWIFDPAALRFAEIQQVDDAPEDGSANSPPFGIQPELALLPDGKVLIAGGTDGVIQPSIVALAMLFDPETETFSPTGSMTVPRRGHSMTALPDGRILVAGGSMFDPPRDGFGNPGPSTLLATAEIYDPVTGTFTPTVNMATVAGPNESLQMSDGRVLVYSALVDDDSDPSQPRDPVAFDMYDPQTGKFTEAGLISRPIDDVAALRDGSILLSGADHYTQRQDDPAGGEYMIDLYRPWAAIFDLKTGSLDDVAAPRTVYPGTVGLQDGRVLFAGGAPYPQGLERWGSINEPWMEIFEEPGL